MKDVYIVSAVRTAVGSLGRALKSVSGQELGSSVISKSLENSNIKKEDVDNLLNKNNMNNDKPPPNMYL